MNSSKQYASFWKPFGLRGGSRVLLDKTFNRAIPAVLFLGVMAIGSIGCTGDEKRAAALLETAQFEERQFNPKQAEKLYNQILERYPETESAETAQARLTALTKGEAGGAP